MQEKTRVRKAIRPIDRERMRSWLISHLNNNSIRGLEWKNKKLGRFKVTWRHAARQGWSLGSDADVFKYWALHTGKYKEGDDIDHKKWKANFRCALNSLSDIEERKEESQTRGSEAVRVYQMLEEESRAGKRSKKKGYQHKPELVKIKMELKSDGEESMSSGDRSPRDRNDEPMEMCTSIPNFEQIDSEEETRSPLKRIQAHGGGGIVLENKPSAIDCVVKFDLKSICCTDPLSVPTQYSLESPESQNLYSNEEGGQYTDDLDLWNTMYIVDDIQPAVVTIRTVQSPDLSELTALKNMELNT